MSQSNDFYGNSNIELLDFPSQKTRRVDCSPESPYRQSSFLVVGSPAYQLERRMGDAITPCAPPCALAYYV